MLELQKKLNSGKVLMSSTYAIDLGQALQETKQQLELSKQEYAACRDTCSNLVTLVWSMREELDSIRKTVGMLMIGR